MVTKRAGCCRLVPRQPCPCCRKTLGHQINKGSGHQTRTCADSETCIRPETCPWLAASSICFISWIVFVQGHHGSSSTRHVRSRQGSRGLTVVVAQVSADGKAWSTSSEHWYRCLKLHDFLLGRMNYDLWVLVDDGVSLCLFSCVDIVLNSSDQITNQTSALSRHRD
jgi:hypothetical protein